MKSPLLKTDEIRNQIDNFSFSEKLLAKFPNTQTNNDNLNKISFLPNVNKKNKIKLKPITEKVEAFITTDKNFLNQYYQLRNEVFQNEKGWNSRNWLENEFDRKGKIVIAINENKEVIGGLRIMSSTNNANLSDEYPGTIYTYRNLLARLAFDYQADYVEFDGMVIKPEYRNRKVILEIVSAAVSYSLSLGCRYMIALSTLLQCRNDRAVLNSLGYSKAVIEKSFCWKQLPDYNYSVDYPLVCDLKHYNSKTNYN